MFIKKISTLNIMNIKDTIIIFLIYLFIIIFSLWNQQIISFDSPDVKKTKEQLLLINLKLKNNKKSDIKK